MFNTKLFILLLIMFLTEESSKKHPFPCPCTYRTALTYYLDITSNPRTHIMKELIEYASDPKVCFFTYLNLKIINYNLFIFVLL